jgi:hypothetical protein
MTLSHQLQAALGESVADRAKRILRKVTMYGGGVVSAERAKEMWGIEKRHLDHLVRTGHLKVLKSGKHAGSYEITGKGVEARRRAQREDLDAAFEASVAEVKGYGGCPVCGRSGHPSTSRERGKNGKTTCGACGETTETRRWEDGGIVVEEE